MNLFTRTFSKIFKSSNQQELDGIQNLIEAINKNISITIYLLFSILKLEVLNQAAVVLSVFDLFLECTIIG